MSKRTVRSIGKGSLPANKREWPRIRKELFQNFLPWPEVGSSFLKLSHVVQMVPICVDSRKGGLAHRKNICHKEAEQCCLHGGSAGGDEGADAHDHEGEAEGGHDYLRHIGGREGDLTHFRHQPPDRHQKSDEANNNSRVHEVFTHPLHRLSSEAEKSEQEAEYSRDESRKTRLVIHHPVDVPDDTGEYQENAKYDSCYGHNFYINGRAYSRSTDRRVKIRRICAA